MQASIIIPIEENRLELFAKSIKEYLRFGIDEDIEFILVSRTLGTVKGLFAGINMSIIKYSLSGEGFSQAHALNLGIKHAKYNNIIVTSPEIMPKTNVLQQLSVLPRGNYICQVFAQNEQGVEYMSLVNKKFRGETPAMHFLGCFKKEDLEYINGWSLDYTRGSGAYDDDDFGDRFIKAGLNFEIREEIQAVHQWHPTHSINNDWLKNQEIFLKQKMSNNYYAKNGLKETNCEVEV